MMLASSGISPRASPRLGRGGLVARPTIKLQAVSLRRLLLPGQGALLSVGAWQSHWQPGAPPRLQCSRRRQLSVSIFPPCGVSLQPSSLASRASKTPQPAFPPDIERLALFLSLPVPEAAQLKRWAAATLSKRLSDAFALHGPLGLGASPRAFRRAVRDRGLPSTQSTQDLARAVRRWDAETEAVRWELAKNAGDSAGGATGHPSTYHPLFPPPLVSHQALRAVQLALRCLPHLSNRNVDALLESLGEPPVRPRVALHAQGVLVARALRFLGGAGALLRWARGQAWARSLEARGMVEQLREFIHRRHGPEAVQTLDASASLAAHASCLACFEAAAAVVAALGGEVEGASDRMLAAVKGPVDSDFLPTPLSHAPWEPWPGGPAPFPQDYAVARRRPAASDVWAGVERAARDVIVGDEEALRRQEALARGRERVSVEALREATRGAGDEEPTGGEGEDENRDENESYTPHDVEKGMSDSEGALDAVALQPQSPELSEETLANLEQNRADPTLDELAKALARPSLAPSLASSPPDRISVALLVSAGDTDAPELSRARQILSALLPDEACQAMLTHVPQEGAAPRPNLTVTVLELSGDCCTVLCWDDLRCSESPPAPSDAPTEKRQLSRTQVHQAWDMVLDLTPDGETDLEDPLAFQRCLRECGSSFAGSECYALSPKSAHQSCAGLEQRLRAWLDSLPLAPPVRGPALAVRAVEASVVVARTLAPSPFLASLAMLSFIAAHPRASIVAELIRPEAVHFAITVLPVAQPSGTLAYAALPASEASQTDPEDAYFAHHVELRRHQAVLDGQMSASDARQAAEDVLDRRGAAVAYAEAGGAVWRASQTPSFQTACVSLPPAALAALRREACRLCEIHGLRQPATLWGWAVLDGSFEGDTFDWRGREEEEAATLAALREEVPKGTPVDASARRVQGDGAESVAWTRPDLARAQAWHRKLQQGGRAEVESSSAKEDTLSANEDASSRDVQSWDLFSLSGWEALRNPVPPEKLAMEELALNAPLTARHPGVRSRPCFSATGERYPALEEQGSWTSSSAITSPWVNVLPPLPHFRLSGVQPQAFVALERLAEAEADAGRGLIPAAAHASAPRPWIKEGLPPVHSLAASQLIPPPADLAPRYGRWEEVELDDSTRAHWSQHNVVPASILPSPLRPGLKLWNVDERPDAAGGEPSALLPGTAHVALTRMTRCRGMADRSSLVVQQAAVVGLGVEDLVRVVFNAQSSSARARLPYSHRAPTPRTDAERREAAERGSELALRDHLDAAMSPGSGDALMGAVARAGEEAGDPVVRAASLSTEQLSLFLMAESAARAEIPSLHDALAEKVGMGCGDEVMTSRSFEASAAAMADGSPPPFSVEDGMESKATSVEEVSQRPDSEAALATPLEELWAEALTNPGSPPDAFQSAMISIHQAKDQRFGPLLAPPSPDNKLDVWVLCGGEGREADTSLAAAQDVVRALQGLACVNEVQAFLLEPDGAGWNQERHARHALRERELRMKMGLDDDQLKNWEPHLLESRIRHPRADKYWNMSCFGVYKLAGTNLLAPSVSELIKSCQTRMRHQGTVSLAADGLDPGEAEMLAAREGLRRAGVKALASSAWGGSFDPEAFESGLEHCFFRDWLQRADENSVLVLPLVRGERVSQWRLQKFLDREGVAYAGSRHGVAEMCADRTLLNRAVERIASKAEDTECMLEPPRLWTILRGEDLTPSAAPPAPPPPGMEPGIRIRAVLEGRLPMPKPGEWTTYADTDAEEWRTVGAARDPLLAALAETPPRVHPYDRTCEKLGVDAVQGFVLWPGRFDPGSPPRPGVARVTSRAEYDAYMEARRREAGSVLGGVLSRHPRDVPMPLPPPPTLVAEAWSSVSGGATRTSSSWLPLVVSLIGDGQSGLCLGPTLLTLDEASELPIGHAPVFLSSLLGAEQGQDGVSLTVEGFALEDRIRRSCQSLAHNLGLQGACVLEILFNAETNALRLVHVDPLPDCSRQSILAFHAASDPRAPLPYATLAAWLLACAAQRVPDRALAQARRISDAAYSEASHELLRIDPGNLLVEQADVPKPRRGEEKRRTLYSGVTDKELDQFEVPDEDSALHGTWHWSSEDAQ